MQKEVKGKNVILVGVPPFQQKVKPPVFSADEEDDTGGGALTRGID